MPRFRNLEPFDRRGPSHILRWKVLDTIAGKRRKDRNEPFVTPRVDNDGARLHAPEPSLTWIGHATFVLRLGGLVIATDPIWSKRLGPVRRNASPGVAIENLPPVDVVTISHAHYDHLDLRTLARISAHTTKLRGTPPLFLVPSEVSRYLLGLGPVIERGWWEDHHVDDTSADSRGGVTFSFVPQQHWSMRMPWDRDATLWGGWVMKSREGTAYHAGDTAWFPHFAAIGERKGPIDWAMLPIGAYDPQWFMQPQHMGPEEAGRAFTALGAKNLVCMHWGTYQLTDEPLSEPPVRIARWWKDEGPGEGERDRLWTMAVGETRALNPVSSPAR
jgi:N-acyl-phosphatidylethanolamine-hydrolysing phospholipase D